MATVAAGISPASAASLAPSSRLAATRGPVAASKAFRAYLEAPATLRAGQAGLLRVVVEGLSPYKCNDRYPQRFVPEASEGVRFERASVRETRFASNRAVMDVALTPLRAGEQQVVGLLSFSVCSDRECLIEKQRLSLTIDVQPSP